METNKNGITYKVLKKLAVLKGRGGYTKELRIVDWKGFGPRLDLREWMPDGKCSKGITLSDDEGRQLYGALSVYFNEKKNGRMIEAEDEDLPFG